jgi:iron-sulfur cluster assembly accessory protein
MAPTLEAPIAPESIISQIDCPINLTDNAAQEVRDILEQQGNPEGVALRIYVAGGGCSGLQYGMALDENVEEGDQFFQDKGVSVVIDPMSLKYITGSIVDYVTTPMGGGFKVENPNATKSCGCGSSFSTGEEGMDGLETSSGGGCGSCGSH